MIEAFTLDLEFNKLEGALAEKGFLFQDENLGGILSSFLNYFFIFSGFALLAYLLLGGFQLLTSGGDPKAVEGAKGKITNALLGFVIIFVSYWLMQLIQTILGLSGPF